MLGHSSFQSSTAEGGEDVTSLVETETVMLIGVDVLINSTSCWDDVSVYSDDFTSWMWDFAFLNALPHSEERQKKINGNKIINENKIKNKEVHY